MRTHGLPSTYKTGCRCKACTAANTRYVGQAKRARRERLGSAGIVHGASAYANWGCRCDVCTAANTRRSTPYARDYAVRGQAETSRGAVRRASRWTDAEKKLALRRDLTVLQVAMITGRTLYSVKAARLALSKTAPHTV